MNKIKMLVGLVLFVSLTACGKVETDGHTESSTIVESSQEESRQEKQEEMKESQDVEMELPNWKGAYADGSAR